MKSGCWITPTFNSFKMLNPECVDKISVGTAKITFTDSDGENSVDIFISTYDIMSLARMIQDKFSLKAQREDKN